MKNKYLIFTFLFFGCDYQKTIDTRYNIPQLWDEPISDYLNVGQETYPNNFDTRIGALRVHENKLWIGYGDTRVNMGSTMQMSNFDEKSEKDKKNLDRQGKKT